jgi:hypothetical protein
VGDPGGREEEPATVGADVLLEGLAVEAPLDGQELALDAALERDEGQALVELAGPVEPAGLS